jgi:hypothetical protein
MRRFRAAASVKLTRENCFQIGTIGNIFAADLGRLGAAILPVRPAWPLAQPPVLKFAQEERPGKTGVQSLEFYST